MSAPSSNNKQTKRPINSCINCASRKVKCDRNYPCNTCSKRHAECVYHPSQPPRKKCARVKELTERLRHCEERLRVVTTTPVESRLQISPLTVPEQTVKVTQIVQDNECTRVVDNSLWRRIAEEVSRSATDTIAVLMLLAGQLDSCFRCFRRATRFCTGSLFKGSASTSLF